MTYDILGTSAKIALVKADSIIADAQSAIDLIMSARYETGCERLILDKSVFAEEFFILSTGLAGEILQKFVNYHMKAAIVGDYSHYTSKPLRDFIYESNNGNSVFFVATVDEAIHKLEHAA
ncbi:MAG: putative Cytosolic Protein [Oscillospiraceae bacterium]|nr:putative Cytosolic Protein [Oscillospiraceae bacterium]